MSEVRRVRQNAKNEAVEIEVCPLDEFDASLLSPGSEVHVLLGEADWEMVGTIFGPWENGGILLQAPRDLNWVQLLHKLGCFSSRGQAMKEWCGARGNPLEIRPGFHSFAIGQDRKIWVVAWKPMHPPTNG